MKRHRFVVGAAIAALIALKGATYSTAYAMHSATSVVPDTTDCIDTLHASDSVKALVKMSVKPQNPKMTLPRDFEGLLAQEFRSRLRLPNNLPLSVMMGWGQCDSVAGKCAGGVLMLGTQAYATVHAGGTFSRIVLVDFALTPALADSVRAVLQRMSDERMVPYSAGTDSIPLDISISAEENPDTVPTFRHLFRATLPHYRAQFSYAAWPKNAKGPKYPAIAERARVADSVLLSFTTLSDGAVAPQSVDVHAGHYTDFIRSVFDRMATIRYVPARIGSCPVPTWETQAFVFKIP
ncbi:MAG: hypothetical protein ACJ8AJ_03515 [Gemmatimonadaceae bacterium]